MSSPRIWLAGSIMALACGSLAIALYIKISDKSGALLFVIYSLILALWATAAGAPSPPSASDVVSLL